MVKKRVFIAQPFDGQKYDQRYKDVYEPAISQAGFEPYRVDRDPTASIPIEEVENNIESAIFVFSDISEDNPNVWFEVGYAIAKGKEICFVCSRDRLTKDRKFPFDIQHRSIIIYDNNSRSDWDALEKNIAARMDGIKKRIENNAVIESAIVERKMETSKKTISLSEIELAGFAIIASEVPIDSGLAEYRYNDQMDKKGFTGIAANVSIRRLIGENLIERIFLEDYDGDKYAAFRLTDIGWNFLEGNLGVFSMRKTKPVGLGLGAADEIPF
jgi:hypothetical protein